MDIEKVASETPEKIVTTKLDYSENLEVKRYKKSFKAI